MRYNLYFFDKYGIPNTKVSMDDRDQAMSMFLKYMNGKHIELTAEFDVQDNHVEIYTERI